MTRKRDKNGRFVRTLPDKKCLVCKKVFSSPVKSRKYCSRECYYEMKRIRGDRVQWTKEMRLSLSKKYRGKRNPAYGKPAWSRGKKRPDITGKKHPNYKGGWLQHGYHFVHHNGRQIAKHKLMMEQHLGRKLDDNEIVHHINENKLDNRIENFQVLTRSEHAKLHFKNLII